MKYFLSVVSMVLIIEGIPYFMFPKKFKEILHMMEEVKEPFLRIIGLCMILCGLILLYLAR